MRKHSFKFIAAAAILIFISCNNKSKVKEPQVVNENEVITTLIVDLVDSSDISKKIRLKSTDLNPGDNLPPIFEIPELEDNKTYYGEILLLDESKTEIDTISNAVAEEKEDHQFVYSTNHLGFSVDYLNTDIDANGYHVGLKPIIKTKNISGQKVNLQVILYHLPGIKKASPVENAKNGSADIETIFSGIGIK
jgi:hypothetical protein